MAEFNGIDALVLFLCAGAFYFGIRLGFFRLLFTFGGFFAGMFLVGLLLPHILPIHNRTALAIINGNLVFILAVFAALKGYDYGKRIHLSLEKRKMHIVESAAGIGFSVGSAVVIIWLVAAAFGALPFVGLSNAVNESFFIQLFDRHLPAAPAVFEGFSTLVDPNITPRVFVKAAPNSSIGAAPLPSVSQAVLQAGDSVVRITSFGCGGIIEGSGFVISPGLIATNAHVIAGVKRPIIKYKNKSFIGQPVIFDPNLDFAVLRVRGLPAPPLSLNSSDLLNNTAINVISFPASIYTIATGRIIESLPAQGNNIYGLGTITRNIYVLHTPINYGSSGGPVLSQDGSVVGIVFARSSTDPAYAYAMVSSSFADLVNQAQHTTTSTGTGVCYTGE